MTGQILNINLTTPALSGANTLESVAAGARANAPIGSGSVSPIPLPGALPLFVQGLAHWVCSVGGKKESRITRFVTKISNSISERPPRGGLFCLRLTHVLMSAFGPKRTSEQAEKPAISLWL